MRVAGERSSQLSEAEASSRVAYEVRWTQPLNQPPKLGFLSAIGASYWAMSFAVEPEFDD